MAAGGVLGVRTVSVLDYPAGEGECVTGVARYAEADGDLAHECLGSRPVGRVTLDEAGGEDIEQDVLAAALDGPVPVVVNILEVPSRDRSRDHERRRDLDHQLRQH